MPQREITSLKKQQEQQQTSMNVPYSDGWVQGRLCVGSGRHFCIVVVIFA